MVESQHELRISVGVALRNAVTSILHDELLSLERSIITACEEVLNVHISQAPSALESDSAESSRRHSRLSVSSTRRLSTVSTQSIFHRSAYDLPNGKSTPLQKSTLAKQVEAKRFKGQNLFDGSYLQPVPSGGNDSEATESPTHSPTPTSMHIPELPIPNEPVDEKSDSIGTLNQIIRETDQSGDETTSDNDANERSGETFDTVGDMQSPVRKAPNANAPSGSESFMSTFSSLWTPSAPSSAFATSSVVPHSPSISSKATDFTMCGSLSNGSTLSKLPLRRPKRASTAGTAGLVSRVNSIGSSRFKNTIMDRLQNKKNGLSLTPRMSETSCTSGGTAAFSDIAERPKTLASRSASIEEEVPNGRRANRTATSALTSMMMGGLSDIQGRLAKMSPNIFSALAPVETPNASFIDEDIVDEEECIEFQLREAWRIADPEGGEIEDNMHHGGGRTYGLEKARSQFLSNKSDPSQIQYTTSKPYTPPWWMISPHSSKRLSWDIFSAFFILYDGVTTPLQFFDMEPTTFTTVLQWMIRIFWTVDMPLTCMSGYNRQDGEVEMKPGAVFVRYVKTWLFIDILVVFADWLDVLLGASGFSASGNAARLSKVMRIVRILRMVRLLRVGRLPQIFERLSDLMPMHINFVIRAAASVLKITGLILLITHCIACAWYAVGDMGGSPNWIVDHKTGPDGELQIDKLEKGYLYLTAFHWSLTQFSGSMEVFPTNTRERLLAVMTLMFSFMASNIFVSSLTSSMTRFQLVASRQSKMFAELRKYLERNNIVPSLAIRLNRNALFAYKEEQKNIKEDEIELLKYVSEPLRIELHFAIYAPVLSEHKFFASLLDVDWHGQTNMLTRICHKDVSTRRFMPGDIIFTYGEEPEDAAECLKMLFLLQGTLRYTRANNGTSSTTANTEAFAEVIEKGTWMSEAVLWVKWMFFGELRATGTCTLVLIGPEEMQHITAHGGSTKMALYAKGFAHVLSRTPLDEMTDIGTNSQVESALYHAGRFAAGES